MDHSLQPLPNGRKKKMIKFLYCNNGTGIKLNEKKIMNAIPSEEEWKAQQKFYKKHSEEVYSTIVQEETIKYGLSREHFKIGIHIPNEEIAKGFSIEYEIFYCQYGVNSK